NTKISENKLKYSIGKQPEFKTENEQLAMLLKSYINPDFYQLLDDLVEGASLKGFEGVYYWFDSTGKIHFEIADSYNLIFLNDEYGELAQVIRHYTVKVAKNVKQETVQKAEVFNEDGTHYFVKNKSGYVLDITQELNPRPFKMLRQGDKVYKPTGPQQLPFLMMENNKQLTPDLNGIK